MDDLEKLKNRVSQYVVPENQLKGTRKKIEKKEKAENAVNIIQNIVKPLELKITEDGKNQEKESQVGKKRDLKYELKIEENELF